MRDHDQEEKLRIAKVLEKLGVNVIEASFPAASPCKIESVRRIADDALRKRRDQRWSKLDGGSLFRLPFMHSMNDTAPNL